MRYRVALAILCFVAQHDLPLLARSQTERHGVRAHYTSIAPAGGLEGRAFLPVSTQGVDVAPSPSGACAATPRLSIRASLARGPLRALKFAVPARKAGRVLLSTTDCAGAAIEATLEDGAVLVGERGYIEIQSEPSAGDPTFRGNFALTTQLRGAPLTLEGTFVVPATKKTGSP